jgi:hypothetical protein
MNLALIRGLLWELILHTLHTFTLRRTLLLLWLVFMLVEPYPAIIYGFHSGISAYSVRLAIT